MTYRELFDCAKNRLKEAEIKDPDPDAWLLFSAASRMEKKDFYLREKEEADEEEQKTLSDYVEERIKRVPVQYILGKADFFGFSFEVNRDVLIPRADTETLVEEILRALPEKGRMLELCTGSGCIALSVKKKRPDAEVAASDISKAALTVAKTNAKKLDAKVTFLESDLFKEIGSQYHVITANPPYIETEEIETLEPEVRDYEPRLALDGREDGLSFYRRILSEAGKYLMRQGSLLVEIGDRQGNEVASMFSAAGFSRVRIIKDLAGKDRVVRGEWINHV